MTYKNLHISFDEPKKDSVLADINILKAKLAFLISLKAGERRKISRKGALQYSFMDKCVDYAQKQPGLMPSFVDVDEMKDDLSSARNLEVVKNEVKSLLKLLEDTVLTLYDETFSQSSVIYSSLKNANKCNVPGVDAIVDDLKRNFPNTGKKKKKAETSTLKD